MAEKEVAVMQYNDSVHFSQRDEKKHAPHTTSKSAYQLILLFLPLLFDS